MSIAASAQTKNIGDQTRVSEFESVAKSRWQRTDAEVLGPNDPLDLKRKNPKNQNEKFGIDGSTPRIIAGLILLILIGAGAYVWFNNRSDSGLFRNKPRDIVIAASGDPDSLGLDTVADSNFSLDSIRHAKDRHEALHLLLVNGLANAARQNNIPLRRSLTARDVVARLPNNWQYRSIVQELVARTEPVLFGGREIDARQFDVLLETVKPLFRKKGMMSL